MASDSGPAPPAGPVGPGPAGAPSGPVTGYGTPPTAGSADLETAEPGEERVSTLELFFDLVFVFGFTQITGSISDNTTAAGLVHGVLVFAVLWWAWGAYAWLTNTVSTGETAPRAVVLAAMVAMLITGLAVPTVFGDGGAAFAGAYLAVMVLHAVLFVLEGENPKDTRRAILRLVPTNVGAGIVLLVAAGTDGTVQVLLWAAAIVVCYAGPYVSGVSGFTIHPGHFVERHGLIVIVALGESIVAIGAGNDDIALAWSLAGTSLLVITLLIGLWWTYFDAEAVDEELTLARAAGAERARLARDVYSYLHIPLVLGVVLAAVGIHEALLHPGDPFDPVVGGALGAGVALFFGGVVAIRLRRHARPGWAPVAGVVAAAAVGVAAAHIPAAASFAVLSATSLVVALGTRREPSSELVDESAAAAS